MIFDTHAHYDEKAFDPDREELLASLPGRGVGCIVNVGASPQGARASAAFARKYDHMYAAVGIHPLGEPWPVSVAHPYYPGRTAHTFRLQDGSLSVSGKDPRGRGHIIDPSTGNTVEKEGFVAVTGPSAMVTEVLSTALWVAPEVRRGEILSGFEGYQAWDILCLTDGNTRIMKI